VSRFRSSLILCISDAWYHLFSRNVVVWFVNNDNVHDWSP